MNEARREQLAKARSLLTDASDIVESVRDEEQETLDNMPDAIRSGIKGDLYQAAIDNMESTIAQIEQALTGIDEASV